MPFGHCCTGCIYVAAALAGRVGPLMTSATDAGCQTQWAGTKAAINDKRAGVRPSISAMAHTSDLAGRLIDQTVSAVTNNQAHIIAGTHLFCDEGELTISRDVTACS